MQIVPWDFLEPLIDRCYPPASGVLLRGLHLQKVEFGTAYSDAFV